MGFLSRTKIMAAILATSANLIHEHIITKKQADLMVKIAVNPVNLMYGENSLDIGLAKNKFIASAVIFSRLYAIYSTSPSVKSSRASLDDNLPQHLNNLREENANMGIGTLITHTHWRLAFEAALYLGGEHPDDLGAVIMASSLETWSRQ